MSFSVGIVGFPNAGKSTLFEALTKKKVEIAPFPFTTLHPNIGQVSIPDERLEKLAEIVKPEKITPTFIEFIDIAGLVKGAHMGLGLGNQFLAQIRECDAILEVVRAFIDEKVQHPANEINPKRDIEIIKTELLMKDLETIENAILKLRNVKDEEKKLNIFQKTKEEISKGKEAREIELKDQEREFLKELQLLTEKPILYVVNRGEKDASFQKEDLPNFLEFNLKLEKEISELQEKEKEEMGLKGSLEKLILECYKVLDLITFYTIAREKETKAWTLKRGENIREAARKIHSDFYKRFIKAQVINFKNLMSVDSWHKAKEKGLIKIEGKEYIIQDGDIIEIKI